MKYLSCEFSVVASQKKHVCTWLTTLKSLIPQFYLARQGVN